MVQPSRWRNIGQSVVLIIGMVGLAMLSAFIVFGAAGVFWAAVGFSLVVILSPSLPPEVTLALYRARTIPEHSFPQGHALVRQLAARAALPAIPALYHVPSPMLNAFTVGRPGNAAIAVTDGMLRTLTYDEFAGVMAHEVAHIAHNDLWTMTLADSLSRMTNLLSFVGLVIIFINLPLILLGMAPGSWSFAFVLVFAPTVMTLLQLGLSRSREYDADLKAAELTGNPRGLASALTKLEHYQGGMWERLFMPGRRVPDPSLLRTHPPTQERVRRLMDLLPQRTAPSIPIGLDTATMGTPVPPGYRIVRVAPRWHWTGVWY
ncbi:MAG: zinc metalloprotease HtpX [Alphaproteobacteria bacterium]